MKNQNMGLIGLGVMGRNLALNMAENGFSVVTYDPWESARTDFIADLNTTDSSLISVCSNAEELVRNLPVPRTILIMVKAGEPVDAVIDQLSAHMQAGDTLIDGGNSHYRDTIQRESELNKKGLHFIGLGISGGEEGARHGPSMMAGGNADAYDRVRNILEGISAKFEGSPCCALVGNDGAGHFVKMIHNGIEYGIMQLIAESYVLLRDIAEVSHAEMSEIFNRWNESELSSYLVEITAKILSKEDELASGPLVEVIMDKAKQKGTGRWSSEAALEFGIPTPTITEAVFARHLAFLKDERLAAAAALPGTQTSPLIEDKAAFINSIYQALLGAVIATYAQGLSVIEAAGRQQNWDINMAKIAAIWRDGCVIRARLLDDVMHSYGNDNAPLNLMCAPHFARMLLDSQSGWRETVVMAVQHGIPVPGLISALSYFDAYRNPRLSANMIQAQRDYFGAHTYERTDRPGSFHTEWSH